MNDIEPRNKKPALFILFILSAIVLVYSVLAARGPEGNYSLIFIILLAYGFLVATSIILYQEFRKQRFILPSIFFGIIAISPVVMIIITVIYKLFLGY